MMDFKLNKAFMDLTDYIVAKEHALGNRDLFIFDFIFKMGAAFARF